MSQSARKLSQSSRPIKAVEKPTPIRLRPDFRDTLRAQILDACSRFEVSAISNDKEYLRALHLFAKRQAPGFCPEILQKLFKKHRTKFRNGYQIDPAKISPSLHFVKSKGTTGSEIFRLVRGMWSMPHNKGYGRRLRFIVYDEYHEAVIGIIGLQSPPADLSSRDSLFSYPEGKKLDLVNSTMDAFTVGAIPPYSYLLGGKLCAGLISTDAVRQAYWRQYAGEKTWMNDQSISQPLAAVTTTGAFGRSSMYNRLRYGDRLLAEPIGYTLGFGTLHLEHLYSSICALLRSSNAHKVGGFGNGPKIRWQNIANALGALDLPGSLLKHGVRREVFMFRLVENLEEGMAGGNFGNPIPLSVDDYSQYWKDRWACPRATRFPLWNTADDLEILQKALTGQ
jgi:hypothetical protein